jgi:hypothetical protein
LPIGYIGRISVNKKATKYLKMAKFCVGHRFMFHFNSLFLLAFLFGLALSNQFEIKGTVASS